MKTGIRGIFAVLALGILGTACFADLAPYHHPRRPEPRPEPVQSTTMVITGTDSAGHPILTIPKSVVQRLAASAADTNKSDIGSVPPAGRFSSAATILAGLFLSLGIIAGGLWLYGRRRGMPQAAYLIIAAVIAVPFLGGLVMADIRPPGIGGGAFGGGVPAAGMGVLLIFAGLAACCVVLFRTRVNGSRRKILATVAVLISLLIATVAMADMSVPERNPYDAGTLPKAVEKAGGPLSGQVEIKVADDTDRITLTLPVTADKAK